jgi:transposase
MLSFPASLKVFLCIDPCDMRKGFEGLTALVAERLKEDLRSGALFVFTNRTHTRLKVLCWDGTGLWLLCKRLEQGRFSWPKSSAVEGNTTKLKLSPEAFAMLTDGIELRGAKMLPWFERE